MAQLSRGTRALRRLSGRGARLAGAAARGGAPDRYPWREGPRAREPPAGAIGEIRSRARAAPGYRLERPWWKPRGVREGAPSLGQRRRAHARYRSDLAHAIEP